MKFFSKISKPKLDPEKIVKSFSNIVYFFISFIDKHLYEISFSLILLLAAFLRFFKLDTLPPGLHTKEASWGIKSIDILENGLGANLKGSILSLLEIIPLKIIGFYDLSLRIIPAVMGVLTVFLLFLFVKEWFNARTAFFASFLLAISSWHILFSRNVEPRILIPAILLFLFILTTKIIRTPNLFYVVLLGILTGLSLYVSFILWILPLIFILGFIFLLFTKRKFFKIFKKQIIIGVVTCFVVALPILVLFARDPSVFTKEIYFKGYFRILVNLYKSFTTFNFEGDKNFFHNLGGVSLLDPFTKVTFVLGFMYAMYKSRKFKYFFLIAWFFVMLIPQLFYYNVPDASFLLIVLPPVYIFSALVLDFVLERWFSAFPFNKLAQTLGVFLLGIFLFTSFVYNYKRYFIAWAYSPETYTEYREDKSMIAQYFNDLPNEDNKFILEDAANNILSFLTYEKSEFTEVNPTQIDLVKLEEGENIFVFEVGKEVYLRKIQMKYPQGKLEIYNSPITKQELFLSYILEVKKQEDKKVDQ